MEHIVGVGGFGTVYKAYHDDWGRVAYKKIKGEYTDDR